MKKSTLISLGSAVVSLVVGYGIKKGTEKLKAKYVDGREENTDYNGETIRN